MVNKDPPGEISRKTDKGFADTVLSAVAQIKARVEDIRRPKARKISVIFFRAPVVKIHQEK